MTQYKYKTQIKIKRGCKKCKVGNNNPIYALGLCQYHYQIHSLNRRVEKNKTVEEKQTDTALVQWFEDRLKEFEGRCSETGDRIQYDEKRRFYSVAHVLPKAIFPSVALHPLNRIELGWQAHHDYDDWLAKHDIRLAQMRVFPQIIETIKILKPFVTEKRRFNNLPQFILDRL